MALWGSAGQKVFWGYHEAIEIGHSFDVVAEILATAGDATLVTLLPGRQQAKMLGSFVIPNHAVSMSVFDVKLLEKHPMPCLLVDDPDDVLFHGRCARSSVSNVVELCAGLGIGTLGLETAGMTPVAAADWSQPFVLAYRDMHPNVPCFCGDIASKETLKLLYKAHPDPASLMCGFSCQPFSRGGQQRGARDLRSTTLYSALRAAYMLRSVAVLLECVEDAASNSMVRQQVESFRDQCGFHLSEIILKLDEIWISRRTRWWATLTADFLGPVQLIAPVPLPIPAHPMELLPRPIAVEPNQLSQLILSGEELDLFLQYQPNLAKLFLPRKGKAPTALHSWGSQVTKCECLCRASGFSHETLSSRGLYGVLFPVYDGSNPEHPDLPRFRHPHPTEVAVLTGVPEMVWNNNLRLCLAGLGQQASPLQSVWVSALLQVKADQVFFGSSEVDPLDCLQTIRGRCIVIAEHLEFAHVPNVEPPLEVHIVMSLDDTSATPWAQFVHQGSSEECTVVHYLDPVPFVVRLSDPEATVAAILVATCELLDIPDANACIIDCSTGLTLNFGHLAAGMCLWIARRPVHVVPPDFVPVSPTLDWQAEEPASTPAQDTSAPGFVPEAVVDAVFDSSPEALVGFDRLGLLRVPEPFVTDLPHAHNLRKQTISTAVRKTLLASQGNTWADDEILWHVDQLLQASRKPTWALLDPLLAAAGMDNPSSGLLAHWIQSFPARPTAVIGVVCVSNHWVPILWTWNSHSLIASCWDIPGPQPDELGVLHQHLAVAVGARTWTVHLVHRSFAITDYCGICAVKFVDHMVRGKLLPSNLDQVKFAHAAAKSQFVQFLDSCSTISRPWFWGNGLDSKAYDRLQSLLLEHGVDQPQTKSRISLMLQAIGLPAVQGALTSGQPWRALKSVANKTKPVFQLILPQELERAVQKKADQGGLRTKRKKQPTPTRAAAVLQAPKALDPAKLFIDEGTFLAPDGSVLSQLLASAIGPFAQGVVVTTVDEVAAFLKAGQIVSKGALALLILNAEEAQVVTNLSWTFARVVLRCQANSEPIIAPAYLVQLGESTVIPKVEQGPKEVLHVPAACCKIAVYRDMVEVPWEQVVRSPVKYVLAHLLPLQVCQSELGHQCTCNKWHPKSDEVVTDPVLDVWRRQWVSLTFKQVAPEQAEIFLFNMRCLESLQPSVLTCSGRSGIFVEPRTLDSRDPLLSYQVLWMPKTQHDELLRLQQCTPQIVGLARLGSRLGVRSTVEDAPTLAKKLKPGSIFLAAGAKLTFEVGPLPYGMDRLTVSRLCSQWNWQARPLHPSRSVDGALGNLWLVQASVDPPNSVVRYQGAEVVITKVQAKADGPVVPAQRVIGSSSTVQMCSKTNEAPATDPWLFQDPWGAAVPTSHGSSMDTQAALKDFEARLETRIMAKLPTADMEVDSNGAHDARFAALEQQVQTLTQNQMTLESKIEETAVRADNQMSALQSQVAHQLDSQGQQMQALFATQMQQIEALLSKKHRTE